MSKPGLISEVTVPILTAVEFFTFKFPYILLFQIELFRTKKITIHQGRLALIEVKIKILDNKKREVLLTKTGDPWYEIMANKKAEMASSLLYTIVNGLTRNIRDVTEFFTIRTKTIIIVVGSCFSDISGCAFYHVALSVLPNTLDSHGHVVLL